MAGITVQAALQEAISKQCLGPSSSITGGKNETMPLGLFYDLDVLEGLLDSAAAAFGYGFLHAVAIKANPLSGILKIIKEKGHGVECASIGEILHCIKLGFEPSKIVFDSPVKTLPELEFSLSKGIHINVDNFQELEILSHLKKKYSESSSFVGVRINPLIGEGDVQALSVSTPDSKFGISLNSDMEKDIISCFVNHPWLRCVHVHVGSQSHPLDELCEGVRRAVHLALKINKTVGRNQVDVIDIGGGLPVNRKDGRHDPTFQEYADQLKKKVPELFPEFGIFNKVITEFGQAFNAKSGWIASRVEYTKRSTTGLTVALIHAGADLLLRTCYCPSVSKYQRRVDAYDKDGNPKSGEPCSHNIAGPLCFAGDIVKRNVMLPKIQAGDFIVIHDCGANSVSIISKHCSRQCPRVYGYRIKGENGTIDLKILKEAEKVENIFHLWGSD